MNGNETAAAELLRAYLVRNGVEVELYAADPARANLVARLRGSGDGPSLAFLSHTDTVVADASEWAHDPWCGDVVDGELWGRGALDMKGQVAASAVAIASLAREGFVPAGDLVFVAAADEESNFTPEPVGLEWLVEAHPDAVRVDCSLNEGGYGRLPARRTGASSTSPPPPRSGRRRSACASAAGPDTRRSRSRPTARS